MSCTTTLCTNDVLPGRVHCADCSIYDRIRKQVALKTLRTVCPHARLSSPCPLREDGLIFYSGAWRTVRAVAARRARNKRKAQSHAERMNRATPEAREKYRARKLLRYHRTNSKQNKARVARARKQRTPAS